MGLGDFLAKVVTAPIKIAVMPIRTIGDLMDDCSDSPIETVTDSIEKQIKEIVE
jgi:hypothetical protein